jgi:hypothetical protein
MINNHVWTPSEFLFFSIFQVGLIIIFFQFKIALESCLLKIITRYQADLIPFNGKNKKENKRKDC